MSTNRFHLTPEAIAYIAQRAAEFKTRVACMRLLREVTQRHPMFETLHRAHTDAQANRFAA